MSDVTIKLYLVNGSGYDYAMSAQEFSDRIIGDDHGPPVSVWTMSFTDADGKEHMLAVDPRDRRDYFHALPITISGDEQARQEWVFGAIVQKCDEIRMLVQALDAERRARARKLVGELSRDC